MDPRRLAARRLARLWVATLSAAAFLSGLLGVLAGSGDPEVLGHARALADARLLQASLAERATALERELAEGGTDCRPALAFRLDDEGRLLDPPPPQWVELPGTAPGVPAGLPSPAALDLAAARIRLAAGAPAEALEMVEEARGALGAGEAGTEAGLLLVQAGGLAALGRAEEARELLADVLERWPEGALLPDGRSLHLVAGLRLAALLDEAGRAARARALRRRLHDSLVAGRLPLGPERAAFEASRLAAALGLPPPKDLAGRLRLRDALAAAMPPPPGRRVLDLGPAGIALLAPDGRTGGAWPGEVLRRCLHDALAALLPAGVFRLQEAAPAAGAMALPLALPPGWPGRLFLVLADPAAYTGPERRRRRFLLAGSAVVVLALLLTAWLGARAIRQRQALDELRSHFLAGVSHDLRTPAAAIAVLAENLAAGTVRSPERIREYHEALHRDATRLRRLVADLLDLSRLERGAFTVQPGPVDIRALLSRVAAEQRPRLEVAGLALEVDLNPDLPADLALDGEALERALWNLLENARRHAAEGGRVRLRAALRGGAVEIRVEDQGPGVPPGWEERIFAPFQRGPGRRGPADTGAGLGLALVAEVVRAHGGRVHVEPGPGGRGAAFVLRLPWTARRREDGPA